MISRFSSTLLTSLMVVGMFFSTGAKAQLESEPDTGSRIAKDAQEMQKTKVRVLMKDVARCVYVKHPDLVLRLLQSSDAGAVDFDRLGFKEGDFLKRFSLSTCLSRSMDRGMSLAQLRLNATVLRSALAEEAYLSARRRTPGIIPEGQPETLLNRYFTSSDNSANSRAFGAFTDCVVYKAPQEADAVLRTQPGSQQEKGAVRALIPALSSCIVKDQEMTLTESGIRTIVADGLWSRNHYGAMADGETTAAATPAED